MGPKENVSSSKLTDTRGHRPGVIAVTKRILPFMKSPKVPRITHISAVVVVSKDESIDDTHHHDSILKAS